MPETAPARDWVEGEAIVDLSAAFPDVLAIVRGGDAALARVAEVATTARAPPLSSVRLLAPIPRPGKYLAIGMNYRKHVDEGAKLGIDAPTKQLCSTSRRPAITGAA